MGFYFRKSISAGPFRFNLSGSGIGMSVGVKGFRIGSGPRGNYIHMGRGGLYYRASLGGTPRNSPHRNPNIVHGYKPEPSPGDPAHQVETGNITEMVPSSGTNIVDQINEKMSLPRLWPWALGLGLLLALVANGQPGAERFALPILFLTAASTAVCWWWDQTRKAVVAMYDLSEEVAASFERFVSAFEKVGLASRVWNVDTAKRTNDWKRNAGAGQLIGRKLAVFTHAVPSVLKTNISVPCIKGGKQHVHFFPDYVLIAEGRRVGAISYDLFEVLWNTTIFIENEGVPPDSQVVGHTWRFVNKNGGPDRRFNNNRQIPEVRYQQMGLRGSGGFQKILHLSRVEDRSAFDAALSGLRTKIASLNNTHSIDAPRTLLTHDGANDEDANLNKWGLVAVAALSLAMAAAIYLAAPEFPKEEPAAAIPQIVEIPKPLPQVAQAALVKKPKDALSIYPYRDSGNAGNFETEAAGNVTEFYRHLETSDGDGAVQLVVPEKRDSGPLSAGVLSAKYSDLREPLHLDNVDLGRNGAVLARYSYMPASGLKCVGIARVTTEKRNEEILISSIKSRESCR